jgi:hypothetical protein
MECEIVRRALLERPLSELDELAAHLERCPRCAALLARVREAEDAIATSLDTFAQGGDFEAAFARASGAQVVPLTPSPTPSYRSVLTVLTIAAVALTAFVVSTVPSEDSPAGETIWAPEPLSVPVEDTAGMSEPVGPAQPTPPVRREEPAAPVLLDVPEPAAPVALEVTEPTAQPEPLQASSAPRPAPADCGELDIYAIQDQAMAGKLGETGALCVELALETASHGDKLVLLSALAIDAKVRKDGPTAERWFAEIRTEMAKDPDLSWRGAVGEAERLPQGAEEVIRLAEEGLASRDYWEGKLQSKRLSDLYRVRAQASHALWQQAEQAGDAAGREQYRALTRQHAQEWHSHAVIAGRDERAARELCQLAGGSCAR